MKKYIALTAFLSFLLFHPLFSQEVGLNIGDKVPDLKMTSPDGKEYSIYDLKGKMVLIDFWASWCSPCRRENPNVVKAYNEFKDKNFKNGEGFTVFGVSLDKDKASWEKAIKDDGLIWPYHVSDLMHWKSEAAKLFKVRGIPTNFLIDGDGIIIGISLRGNNLDSKLKELVVKERSKAELKNDIKNTLIEYQEAIAKALKAETNKKSDNYKALITEQKQIAKALKALKM